MDVHPTREEFLARANQGNLIPVTCRILADLETPLSAYQKLRGQGDSFLFESVEGGEHLGRYSFLGCHPRGIIRQTDDQVDYLESGRVRFSRRVQSHTCGADLNTVRDGLAVVEQVMNQFQPVVLPGLPRFTGPFVRDIIRR